MARKAVDGLIDYLGPAKSSVHVVYFDYLLPPTVTA